VFLGDALEEDWERLLEHTVLLRLAPGEVLAQAGEIDRTLYVLRSGRLAVTFAAPGAATGIIDAGSVAGEVGFLDGGPRSATLEAVGEVEVFALAFESFETLAARYPTLGRRILLDLARILATRLRQATATLDRQGS
jgi:CRP-like cAMP-binding protein